MFDKDLPKNIDAELSVIGSILLDADMADEVTTTIEMSDFYDRELQIVFRHLVEMHANSEPIDHLLLMQRMKDAGDFESAGGAQTLGRAVQAVATPVHAQHYANIVRKNSVSRSVIRAGMEMVQEGFRDSERSSEATIEVAQKVVEDIEKRHQLGSGVVTVGELIDPFIDSLAQRNEAQETVRLTSGFSDLDDIKPLYAAGELVVIGARPGNGKTSLACNMMTTMASRKKSMLFFSIEMSRVEVITRMACSLARVDSTKITRGTLTNDDREKVAKISANLRQSPIRIDDTRDGMTVKRMRSITRTVKRKHGLDAIFVDYLQRVTPENTRAKRYEQVGQIAQDLKTLAKSLGIVVFALAQVGRDAEGRAPIISDLRESGDIEAEADTVMLLHNPSSKGGKTEAEISLAKNRVGSKGKVILDFWPEFTLFSDQQIAHF